MSTNSFTRRDALSGGIAALASAAVVTSDGYAATPEMVSPKKPGEIRAIFLGGDVLHNFLAQEPPLRRMCENMGLTFFSVHDARFLTPALVETADILMIERWDGSQPGWVPGPVFETAMENDDFMSDALADAVHTGVTERGMGFLSIHCTITLAFPRKQKEKLHDMLGVNGIIHGPLQPVHLHDFNQDHPITRGLEPFDLPLDENFGAEIARDDTTPLYEITGFWDKRRDFGGWCRQAGRGRVVGLTAGHTYFAYRDPQYLKLFRRSIHWALGHNDELGEG
jgi:type 1 glutamine amidotransferase